MRFTKSRSLAAISAAIAALACFAAQAAAPRYGGTLHVRLRASRVSLDPHEWTPGSLSSAASEKLASLVYDRLVTLDDYAKFQPALATEWLHDAAGRNWQFRLRPGVRFSDGSLLAPADAVAALQVTLGKGFEVTAIENGIAIRTARSTPDLLERLASGRNFIFRRQPDGMLLGTGPFFVAEWVAAAPAEANPTAIKPAKIKFQANEGAWSGRPFVDFVEVVLGEPPLRQLLDLQVGKADVAEIAPDLVRKGRQEGLRIWSSAPQTLVALRFDDALAAPASDRLREALWLALDRDTMANVLLQREAQPARGSSGRDSAFAIACGRSGGSFQVDRRTCGRECAASQFAGAGCTAGERGQFADAGEWIASVCVALRFAFAACRVGGLCEAIAGQRGFTRQFGGSRAALRAGTTLARRAPHPAAGAPAGVCRRSSKRAQLECIAVGRLAAGRRVA